MGKHLRFAFLALLAVLVVSGTAMADPGDDYREGMNAASHGDMTKAIAAFTRIIEANPPIDARNLAVTYNLRGMCREAVNELQPALADYTKAIEIDPKLAEALGNRSLLHQKLGDEAKAREDAVAARRIDRKVKVAEFDK